MGNMTKSPALQSSSHLTREDSRRLRDLALAARDEARDPDAGQAAWLAFLDALDGVTP